MIFEIISGGEKLTGWGKNGPAYFFPGERMGRPILSPGKKLTGGKFRPVTPDWKKANMDRIKDSLNIDWKQKLEGKDTYSSWNEFKSLLNNSIINNVPMKKRRTKTNKKIWITREIVRQNKKEKTSV